MLKGTLDFLKLLHKGINRKCNISIGYNPIGDYMELDVRWMNSAGSMRCGLKLNLHEDEIIHVLDNSIIVGLLTDRINNQIELMEAGGDEYQKGLNQTRHTGNAVGRPRSNRTR